MSNDPQQSDAEICAEVERRNQLRKEFGLPPVQLQAELDRIHEVQKQRAFDLCMESPLRRRVEEKLLVRFRRSRNDPNWTLVGNLSGGGWEFHAAVVRQMRRLKDRLGDAAS